MTTRKQITLVILLFFYLVTSAVTDFSLTGFWTDIVFSIAFSLFVLITIYKKKTNEFWLTITLRTIAVICSTAVSLFLLGSIFFSFGWDFSKLRNFYFVRVDGRLFNAYFKPVGSYSGGEGNFWITESSIFCPIFERQVYYEHAVLHNFNDDTWEGKNIDNYEIVKTYIRDEIIDKRN